MIKYSLSFSGGALCTPSWPPTCCGSRVCKSPTQLHFLIDWRSLKARPLACSKCACCCCSLGWARLTPWTPERETHLGLPYRDCTHKTSSVQEKRACCSRQMPRAGLRRACLPSFSEHIPLLAHEQGGRTGPGDPFLVGFLLLRSGKQEIRKACCVTTCSGYLWFKHKQNKTKSLTLITLPR